MNAKTIVVLLAILLAGRGGDCKITIVDLDVYPLVEFEFFAGEQETPSQSAAAARLSAFAGAIELEKRPLGLQMRLVPLTFEKVKNQSHLRVLVLGPGIYAYDSEEGVKFEMGTVESDPATWSLLSWRGKSKAPYRSGGFAVLMGQIIANYGFRAADGSRSRVCKFTDALFYENNEKAGRELTSFWGWLFSYEWGKPKDAKAWDFGLARKCLNVGRREGKTYGRLLWVPIGSAPRLWPSWKGMGAKDSAKERERNGQPDKKRRRVSI